MDVYRMGSPVWSGEMGSPKEPPQSIGRCMCARAFRTGVCAVLLRWQGHTYCN